MKKVSQKKKNILGKERSNKKNNKNNRNKNNKEKQKFISFFFIIGFVVILIDQLTKFFARKISQPIDFKLFELRFVRNTGSAFGMFQGENFFITLIGVVILISIIFYLMFWIKNYDELKKRRISSKSEFYLLSFIFWAAFSNLIDRVMFGFITDFIDFKFFPVFNMADATLSVSVIVLLFLLLKKR